MSQIDPDTCPPQLNRTGAPTEKSADYPHEACLTLGTTTKISKRASFYLIRDCDYTEATVRWEASREAVRDGGQPIMFGGTRRPQGKHVV